jgi:hypothetical protein
VGDSITHQMTRASASHPAMDFAFNVASQGAQTACPYPARGTYVSLHQFTANGSHSEAAMSA